MSEKKRINQLKELHERNYRKHGLSMNLTVSLTAAITIFLLVMIMVLFPTSTQAFFNNLLITITSDFSNFFAFIVNLFVIALIILACSSAGKIRIGGKEAKPEFSFTSWTAMLFAAGMGIGLVFWSMAEPMTHYIEGSPMYQGSNYLDGVFSTTMFNWGVHAWAIYGVIAITLAFYTYNMKLPLAPRSFFYPLLKERIYGTFGDIIDGISIIVTLSGLSTSLGLGAKQINAGLSYVFNIPFSSDIQIILIILITLVATYSVMSGLDKGVKTLSNFNLRLAFLFVIIIFILGPTLLNVTSIFSTSFDYIIHLPAESLHLFTIKDQSWLAAWPIFFMAWWISFSPSVGIFIAKISRGRTIREMVFAILIVPTVITLLWIVVFGNFGIELLQQFPDKDNLLLEDPATTFFVGLGLLDYSNILKVILALLFILLMIIFFVTSSDSGSLIVDSLASGGEVNSPKNQRIFWALTEGALAASILYIGGENALNTLQTLVISTGLIFGVIILIALVLFFAYLIKHYLRGDANKNTDITFDKNQ